MDRPAAYAAARMRRRSPARWLAPLALVTAAVAVYAVVQHETSSTKGDGSATNTTATGAGTTTTAKKQSTKKKRSYTVKAGDVLSAIAAKNGTTVQELQRLNPTVDAAALHPGQKLKLPR
jgi:LysM repeat protein